MTNYTEKDLESFIEEYLLTQNNYIKRLDSNYDKTLCLDSTLLLEFLESTQQDKLNEFKKRINGDYETTLLKRLTDQIRNKGIAKALQGYVEANGIKFYLAFPKPSTTNNQTSINNYNKNQLSIIRQLHYSNKNKNSLDMVIFLNGVPIITIELKNCFTGQNVFNAIKQYKEDRDAKEELFNRCIVHFTLDSDLAYMSTKLEGLSTTFLPFNQGLNNGSGEIGIKSGAGNPLRDGIKTSYIWDRILQKDTLLSIIFDFVQDINNRLIFPRYHQFDVVNKLLKDCVKMGVGRRYLIQHSAGSGKSNSISWLALQLTGLHRLNNEGKSELIFDSVIVVTDRKVLDKQIQDNINKFSHIQGVVEAITDGSRQLKDALQEGKKIIISTIQKFPYILEEIQEVKGKQFAIIIDEAHSSQSGISAQKLGETIRDRSIGTIQDINTEDKILEIIKNKKLQPNASYFAFTATPKPKTLEMFGESRIINGIESFIPFHLYSMKQAIEEKFILDVLKGYITYDSYYKLIETIKDEKYYDSKKAKAKLKKYVEGHIHTINKKSQIMIEHFFEKVYKKINGKAKAMIVTSSREKAIKYYFAFSDYLRNNYKEYKALVAFSGELMLDGINYSESSLNNIAETKLKDEFKKDCYKFLIVAEKYQTGFDEPLLHTMYVDKKLNGTSAVQTLSRLNRVCKNKDDTFVLDFANTHEDIKEAFNPFYEQTYLNEATNLDKIFDLKTNLSEYRIYNEYDIKTFINAILNNEREDKIHALLDKNVNNYIDTNKDNQIEFYSKAKTYLREYSFLAQILPYEDISLEKLYIFLKKFITKITPPREEDITQGILDNVDFDGYRVQLNKQKDIILESNGKLMPSQANGETKTKESKLQTLVEIIAEFNQRQGNIEWGDNDEIKEKLKNIKYDIIQDKEIKKIIKKIDMQNAYIKFEEIFNNKLSNLINQTQQEISNFAINLCNEFNKNKAFKEIFSKRMFEYIKEELV